MSLEIRDFVPEDREFFLEAVQEFYDSPAVETPVPKENFERTFDLCIEGSPFAQGMIFWVHGKRVGYALLAFTYSNEAGGLNIFLEEAYVLPEYQGQGIATRFFKMIEKHYVEAGKAKRLSLEVTKENTGAISLYERLGYTRVDYVQMGKDFPEK